MSISTQVAGTSGGVISTWQDANKRLVLHFRNYLNKTSTAQTLSLGTAFTSGALATWRGTTAELPVTFTGAEPALHFVADGVGLVEVASGFSSIAFPTGMVGPLSGICEISGS